VIGDLGEDVSKPGTRVDAPRAIGWNGAGGCVMVAQDRQVNFSRTVWMIFHCRGIDSNVSVMVSPSLANLPLQHGQAVGPGMTTHSRGRCAGKGARTGLARVKLRTVSPSSDCRASAAAASVSSSSS
jgi:hypothetical protein